jgi:hypothetical protein
MVAPAFYAALWPNKRTIGSGAFAKLIKWLRSMFLKNDKNVRSKTNLMSKNLLLVFILVGYISSRTKNTSILLVAANMN